jgi:Uncharacterised nucleotidyltransferase
VTFSLAKEASPAPRHLDARFEESSATFIDLVLWRCGARDLARSDLTQLYDLGKRLSPTAWQTLRERSRAEGMDALLFTHATEAGLLPVMPTDVAETLMATYRSNWIWNRRLRGEQRRIVDAILARGIDVMLVKGVTLAARYYGEIALRPVGDIDVLVRPEDAADCGRILTTCGYTPLPGREKPTQWHALVNRALAYRSDAGITIDLHWALASLPPYVAAFPQAEIWNCAESLGPAGSSARWLSLSTPDELRFLCFHYAAQHRDKRLIWLVDIAEILRALPSTWDWPQFVSDTIARGLATPVAAALDMAQRVLNVKIPAKVMLELHTAASQWKERMAWRAAQASRFGIRAMCQHLRAQDGIAAQLAFARQGLLWHAILPARTRVISLRQTFGERRLRITGAVSGVGES